MWRQRCCLGSTLFRVVSDQVAWRRNFYARSNLATSSGGGGGGTIATDSAGNFYQSMSPADGVLQPDLSKPQTQDFYSVQQWDENGNWRWGWSRFPQGVVSGASRALPYLTQIACCPFGGPLIVCESEGINPSPQITALDVDGNVLWQTGLFDGFTVDYTGVTNLVGCGSTVSLFYMYPNTLLVRSHADGAPVTVMQNPGQKVLTMQCAIDEDDLIYRAYAGLRRQKFLGTIAGGPILVGDVFRTWVNGYQVIDTAATSGTLTGATMAAAIASNFNAVSSGWPYNLNVTATPSANTIIFEANTPGEPFSLALRFTNYGRPNQPTYDGVDISPLGTTPLTIDQVDLAGTRQWINQAVPNVLLHDLPVRYQNGVFAVGGRSNNFASEYGWCYFDQPGNVIFSHGGIVSTDPAIGIYEPRGISSTRVHRYTTGTLKSQILSLDQSTLQQRWMCPFISNGTGPIVPLLMGQSIFLDDGSSIWGCQPVIKADLYPP